MVRYDSVNGVTRGYTVYMTYDNDNAYPAYIITYKYSINPYSLGYQPQPPTARLAYATRVNDPPPVKSPPPKPPPTAARHTRVNAPPPVKSPPPKPPPTARLATRVNAPPPVKSPPPKSSPNSCTIS